MSKKIVTYVLTLAMIFSVFSNPALGYATTEADASDVTNTTAVNEPSDVTETLIEDEVEAENKETSEKTSEGEIVKKETVIKVAKVTGLKAKTMSDKAIKLTWQKVKGATGYQVYRYSKAKGKYVHCFTTKKLTLTNKGLKASTVYNYKVRAYKVKDGKKYFGAFSKMAKSKTAKSDQAKISSLALKKVGSQYKSGAKGPTKFDCSGFVQWVYKNAGVDTKVEVPGGSSAGMYSELDDQMIGSSIKSISKAKTGDIIFFKSGSRVSHVGIYYKDGKMIHAANPKKDVCVEKVSDYERWGLEVVGIARVL